MSAADAIPVDPPEPASLKQLDYFRDLVRDKDVTDMVKAMPDAWIGTMQNILKAIQSTGSTKAVYETKIFVKKDLQTLIGQLIKCPPVQPQTAQPQNSKAMAAWREASKVTTPNPFIGASGTGKAVAVHPFGTAVHQFAEGQPYQDSQSKVVVHAGKVELQDGMYRHPDSGTIYKVYHTVHGSNQQVAKRLVVTQPMAEFNFGMQPAGDATVKFVYEGKKPLSKLRPSMRLSIQEARDFGVLYGTCCICGRTLTNELSIHLGIGPVCGRREFGGEFEFLVEEAKVATEPQPVTIDGEVISVRYDDMNEEQLRAAAKQLGMDL